MLRLGRLSQPRSATNRSVLAYFVAIFGLALLAYSFSTTDAKSPTDGPAPKFIAASFEPHLIRTGVDETITGSVGNLFASPVFSGPNSAAKRDRARPEKDALAVASAFAAVRAQLAAAMPPPPRPKLPDLSTFVRESRRDVSAKLPAVYASVDPALMSAALTAISNAIPVQPVPTEIPTQLAYARANAPATIFATPTSMRVSAKQFNCLATAIYFEARGESYRGQAAVAQVVLNRVKSDFYPNTICGVVYQNQSQRNACQFSFACDGIPETITEPDAWKQAQEIARKVLDGEIYLTEVANATHYHAAYVYPDWAPELKRVTRIGLHIFYRFKTLNG